MRGSMEEKLFFLEHLPEDVTVFADFGCADGSLLAEVFKRRPGVPICMGYDLDPDMVSMVKQGEFYPLVDATAQWKNFKRDLEFHHSLGRKSCLILSSVVHEVLSQGLLMVPFWEAVRDLGCTYVAVRDMAVSSDVGASRRKDIEGLLHEPYRGGPSWEREAAETYLHLNTFHWLYQASWYHSIRFSEHKPLPYLQQWWRDNLGVEVPEATHLKLLLERR